MAKTKGHLGVVLVGAAQTVGEVRGVTLNPVVGVNSGAAMGSQDDQPSAGLIRSTGSFRAWYDAADAGQQAIIEGAVMDIEYRPSGTGSGLPSLSFSNALIAGINYSGEVGTDVEVEFSFEAGGSPTRSTQA